MSQTSIVHEISCTIPFNEKEMWLLKRASELSGDEVDCILFTGIMSFASEIIMSKGTDSDKKVIDEVLKDIPESD